MLRSIHQTRQLASYPEMGRSGRIPGTRESVINRTPFVATYRVKAKTVEIFRLMHGAQRWP